MSFISNRSDFNKKHEAFIDMAAGLLTMDVEIALKTDAGMPVDAGNMKSQTRHFKTDRGNYRAEVDVGYAAYQEMGARSDGTHRVKNYSTSGTSAGFFHRAIQIMLNGRAGRIQQAKEAVGL